MDRLKSAKIEPKIGMLHNKVINAVIIVAQHPNDLDRSRRFTSYMQIKSIKTRPILQGISSTLGLYAENKTQFRAANFYS